MHVLRELKIEANKDELLAKLKANRQEHAAIVAEAREGYVKKAREALEKRLGQLSDGKIVSLSFRLDVPTDHTRVYDTAIRMLELHQNKTVLLTATQVRNLEMDEWDWTDSFLGTASAYSPMANDKLNSR